MSSAVPPLSVVMPVRNAAPFLDAAIGSIVNQTFADFEFVILDDASTDQSFCIATRWAERDARIRVERGSRPLGVVGSSNAVVALARAGIIARMDADDVSHPDRLRRQWNVLAGDTDVALVGTLADGTDGIDAAGHRVLPRDRWRIARRSRLAPFAHGSIMFRRASFESIGGYRDVADAEDYDLYQRMATTGPLITLPDLLYHYRYHGQSATAVRDRPSAALPSDRPGDRASNPHYTRAAMRLWSGEPPGVFRELLADGSCRWTVEGMGMLAWAAWGCLSPASLRWSLRCVTTIRDRVCSLWITDGVGYKWRPEP